MSKAGQRILGTIAFLLISGFSSRQAFAQIPLGNVTPTPERAYVCSSQTVACDSLPTNFVFNEVKKPTPLPQIKVQITKPVASVSESSTLSQTQIEPKKMPQAPPLPTPKPVQVFQYIASVANDAFVDADKIQNLLNEYRTNIGLPTFLEDGNVCSLAKIRSTELAGELAAGILHSGLYNRNLPYWIWENAKVGSDEQGTVSWWLNSPIHKSSIVGNYKYSCGACTGSYCSQLFTNYEPKNAIIASAPEVK